ncbi:hypothetical protein BC829DRAFT_390110, partial [Chytridium lagenaria]
MVDFPTTLPLHHRLPQLWSWSHKVSCSTPHQHPSFTCHHQQVSQCITDPSRCTRPG